MMRRGTFSDQQHFSTQRRETGKWITLDRIDLIQDWLARLGSGRRGYEFDFLIN